MPAGFWLRLIAGLLDLILVLDAAILLTPFAILAAPLYWAMDGTRWNTLGKRLTGIRVLRSDDTPPSYLRCLVRVALYPLMLAGLHDRIMKTKVVLEGELSTSRRVLPALGLCVLLNVPAYHIYGMFQQLIRVGDEGATLGNLGAIRSALLIYYGDMEGQYPADIMTLTRDNKYIRSIPETKLRTYHRRSSKIRLGKTLSDTGQWLYNADPEDTDGFGTFRVDCTHTDHRLRLWSEY